MSTKFTKRKSDEKINLFKNNYLYACKFQKKNIFTEQKTVIVYQIYAHK